MAGRPRERALVLELEQRTRAHFEDDEHTVLDFICAWTEAGKTMRALAGEVSAATKQDYDGEHVSRWLRRHYGADVVAPRLAAAREIGAYSMLDAALYDAEKVYDKDSATVTRVKNDARFFIASKFNRRELGEQKAGLTLNLNVGSLHLDSMRQRSVERMNESAAAVAATHARSTALSVDATSTIHPSTAIASAIDADYELVSDDKPTG